MKNLAPLSVASLVASLFAAGCGVGTTDTVGTTEQAVVKCSGINTCAGTASCAGSLPDGGMHDCAGKNSCAGQGWIEVPKSECTAKGGSIVR